MTAQNVYPSRGAMRPIDRVLRFWKRLAMGAIVVAPALFVGINLLPTYIQNTRAGVGLRAALEDPTDAMAGRYIGNYMRELRDTPIAPQIDVARFNSASIYIGLSRESSWADRLVWHLPGQMSALHDDTKIGMYDSAIQAPLKRCVESLLDSPYGNGGSDLPSTEAADRIHGLARYLGIAPNIPPTTDPMNQGENYTKTKLASCLRIESGIKNFMEEYFKAESKYTSSSGELISFVKGLSLIRTNLERSNQKIGLSCVPGVPALTQGALDKISDLKIVLNSLEGDFNKAASSHATSPETHAVPVKLEEIRQQVGKIESHLRGILSTRAHGSQISSGSMLISFAIWIILVIFFYERFARAIEHLKGASPVGLGSSTPTPTPAAPQASTPNPPQTPNPAQGPSPNPAQGPSSNATQAPPSN